MEIQLTDRMGRKLGQCDLKPRTGSVAAHDYACIDYRLDRDRLVPGAKVPDDADMTPRQRHRRSALEGARDRAEQGRGHAKSFGTRNLFFFSPTETRP